MINVNDNVRIGRVWFKTGHFYSFHYSQFKNDPIPTVIMINYVRGTHPNTGHKHNYIQCINLSYISRAYRKQFVDVWMKVLKMNNGHVKLTWNIVSKKFPYLKFAVRRYLLDGNLIRYARRIELEDVEKEVISTWLRDFSMSAMKQLAILNDRMRKKDPKRKDNTFAKSLSKYLYRYNTRG